MVEKVITQNRNVIDFLSYQRLRKSVDGKATLAAAKSCRHCGAWLTDDESDDDCSSAVLSCEKV